jgi:ABC-2 type transport system permease protein
VRTWLVRALSILVKEIHEVRRQPLLLLSLIGGPFLVLALFGATFRSTKPALRTVLVWPDTGIPGIERGQVEEAIRFNFDLTAVVDDPREALHLLETGQVDVVQILPQNIRSQIEEGRQASIQVYSYAIDPTTEAWIRSMMLGQVNYFNRQMLMDRTGLAQKQALTVQIELSNAKGVLGQLELSLTPERQRQVERAIATVRAVLRTFLTFLQPVEDEVEDLIPLSGDLSDQIERFLIELDRLEQLLESGRLEEQMEQLENVRQKLDELHGTLGIFVQLPPEVIVSPIQADYQNQRGNPYPLMVYFTPRVMALLIQHLAVTLGALALVRERLIGAFEMFRIAPISIAHLLLGKTLAYCSYILAASLTLGILLGLLDVPILGSPILLILLVLLLSIASVGIGLLISAISTSDSQAIQLTMLILLLSVFFTGFFLPLEGFTSIAQPISVILPMTHGLVGLQSLMLVGRVPGISIWLSLVVIILVTYSLVLLIVPRMNRKSMI